jgi:hypothetical protein
MNNDDQVKKGKAFLLVGFLGNWGKSRTFTALNGRYRYISITSSKESGKKLSFSIQRKSNSDIRFDNDIFIQGKSNSDEQFCESNSDKLKDYWQTQAEKWGENLIIAFSTGTKDAEKMLQFLASKYELYCFVLKHKYSNPKEKVPESEIAMLRKYATEVEVYSVQKAEASIRADAFKAFIEKNL